ncbi:AAA family ATPase [Mycoplasmopsis synoviae]|nr:AAA family ATPase [Mycoplasmopsis synoviae]AKB11391.1 ABC transporter ATP-binding protein [Mycoplasmopsis synoviae ATCC 25204]
MKLIKIEAHGFKSFADPISLKFDGGVIAIVGPNGSGKSNINDAIKWVLGEQSSKELRGNNMSDVIFSGSKTAKAMDFAYVTLTFDNKDRFSSIDRDYITITRKITRAKNVNEYYLNGEPTLHKTIKQLAMETGIGKSSLAIISQGKVSEIAQSSEENRRGIFEEAAGISKIKYQKEESERRLLKTIVELEKTQISISHYEKDLNYLEEAAKKALEFKDKKAKLKEVEISYLAHEIGRLQSENEVYVNEINSSSDVVFTLENEIEKLNASEAELKLDLRDKTEKLQSLANQIATDIDLLHKFEKTYNQKDQERSLAASGKLNVSQEEIKSANLSKAKEIKSKLDFLLNKTQKTKFELDDLNSEKSQLESQALMLETQLREVKNAVSNAKAGLDFAKREKESNSSLQKGVRTIVQNRNIFNGYVGLVSELFKIKNEYIHAIDTILSPSMQNIVVKDDKTAKEAVRFLKNNSAGRAVFMPLSSLRAKSIRQDLYYGLQSYNGFLCAANEAVECHPQLEVLRDFLLGNVILATDIDKANEISKLVEQKYMVVTKDGDLIRPGGIIVGGEKKQVSNLLNIDEKIRKSEEFLNKALPSLNVYESKFEKLKTQIQNISNLISVKKLELSSENESISATENELKQYQVFLDDSIDTSSSGESELLTLFNKINELKNQIQQNKFSNSLLNQEKEQIVAKLDDISILLKSKQKDLDKLRQSFSKNEVKFEKNKTYLENHKSRLLEEYGLTFEFARDNFKLNIEINLAKEIVSTLKKEIQEIGSVDEKAIEKYEAIKKDYDFLVTQRNEIQNAIGETKESITILENTMVDKFTSLLRDVNLEFNNIFRSLFGGGSASVSLVDESLPLTSGINIKVQPPGKIIKNINLLSGGEKSLTAISLLFAILKARPLPLCILDEAEGALDDSNVVRYADYLQQLKDKTQFLVITHRHGTMTKSDAIIGATMQNRGITTFLSLSLAEAKKYVDKFEAQN